MVCAIYILCALELKIDGIIFWILAYFVSKKTRLSKVDISMSSFLWKRCNKFFNKWGSVIDILYKKGEIISREVVDLLSGIELSIIFG